MPNYNYEIMGAKICGSHVADSIDTAYIKVIEQYGYDIPGIIVTPVETQELPIWRDFDHVREVKHQLMIKYPRIRTIIHLKYFESFEDIIFQDDQVSVRESVDIPYTFEYCYVKEQPNLQ